jgi:hypothetical protein
VLALVLEEIDFFLALAFVNSPALCFATLNSLAFVLQLDNTCLEGPFLLLELCDSVLSFGLALLGLQLLPCSKSHGALVQCLVGCNRHPDFIANTKKEEAALRAVDSHLTNELVKALRVELFTDRADPSLPGLTLHQTLIQRLLKLNHIETCRRLVGDILDEVLRIFNPFSGWEQCMKDIISVWL